MNGVMKHHTVRVFLTTSRRERRLTGPMDLELESSRQSP